MSQAAVSRELGEALARLAEVDKEIQRCESNEESIDRSLLPLRLQLEQMSIQLERERCATGGAGSFDEVGRCRYRELLGELEEKTGDRPLQETTRATRAPGARYQAQPHPRCDSARNPSRV